MDDGREGLTDIDRAIAQALDVEPSAGFQAVVRHRLARERMRASLWRGWLLWVPIAAAAAVLVAVVLRPPAKPAPSPPALLTSRPLSGGASLPGPGSSRPSRRAGAPEGRAPTRRALTAVAPGTSEPEVLVPCEEIEMYRRLIAGARAVRGAVVVEAPADLAASRTFADITVDPIAIDFIAPPEGREGVRQ